MKHSTFRILRGYFARKSKSLTGVQHHLILRVVLNVVVVNTDTRAHSLGVVPKIPYRQIHWDKNGL